MRVTIQMLLRRDQRTPDGIAAVRRAASQLGITPTASGTASVSAEMDAEAFTALFGVEARPVEPEPPGAHDFGSPGGAVSGSLAVPPDLASHVESITVAPPHRRFTGSS